MRMYGQSLVVARVGHHAQGTHKGRPYVWATYKIDTGSDSPVGVKS